MTIIEQIKNKLDIVEEIGAVVPLKKSGKAYKGACPFHSERTPSFYVFPQTATWRCFGCNEGGDIFTFVEKQQALDFKEALALLAEKAGIPVESRGDVLPDGEEEDQEEAARRRMRQINEAAAIWFHHLLLTSTEASYARTYLDGRGVSHESITLFRLGFAPAGGDLLCNYLLSQKYSAQEIIAAGLGREREPARGGGLYDYFRSRIMFPIRDARGRTIGFGGRELGGGHPKYLNTPQTPLFDKSSILYGLDLAREAIKRRDQVVIVEGYMDTLIAHQYGEKNVVACIGSAITEKHVRQLKKLTKRLALALDPDVAGETATLRGIEAARQGFDRAIVVVPKDAPGAPANRKGEPRGMVRFEEQVDAEITILRLPSGEDPDEVIRRDLDRWRQTVAKALPLIDFLFEALTAGLRLDTPQGKAEAAKRLLPVVMEVRDRVERHEYVVRLARLLRTDERALELELQHLQRAQIRGAQKEPHAAEPVQRSYTNEGGEQQTETRSDPQVMGEATLNGATRPGDAEALEEYCLGLLLAYPSLAPEVYGIIEDSDFSRIEMRALYRAFLSALQPGVLLDTQRMLSTLPEILQETAERLRQRVEEEPSLERIHSFRGRHRQGMQQGGGARWAEEGTYLKKKVTHAAYLLKLARLKEAINELSYLIQEAEQAGDQEEWRILLQRAQDLDLQRRTIHSAVPLHS
jgi:DNA primase